MWSKGGVNSSARPSSSSISSRSTAAIACAARWGSAAPEITAQDCAMEVDPAFVVRRRAEHGAVVEPARADTSRRPMLRCSSDSFSAAACVAPGAGARPCHHVPPPAQQSRSSVAWSNQASQTLSPWPPSPTRFIPSFQSPRADQRKTVAADREARISARAQCS